MRRRLLLLCVALLSFSLLGMTRLHEKRTIRVGVYENAPKIFTVEDGTVSGFWADLISTIAREENWGIVWIHGTWEECLQRLANNEIDIMPDAGWSEPRSEIYTFSKETVLVSWARVYVPKGSTYRDHP